VDRSKTCHLNSKYRVLASALLESGFRISFLTSPCASWVVHMGTIQAQIVCSGGDPGTNCVFWWRQNEAINIEQSALGYCFDAEITRADTAGKERHFCRPLFRIVADHSRTLEIHQSKIQ
jgi:hypothetical protein